MKAVERHGSARLDRGEEIAHRGLAEPFAHPQLRQAAVPSRACSVKMSAAVLISPSLKNSSICLSPSPSMSKALREAEMLEALDRLRGADEARRCSGARRRPRRSFRRSRAAPPSRRPGRRAERRKASRRAAACRRRPEDLRNDVAGALHVDRVADAHVLPRDLVLVVQRRVGDDDAADGDRIAASPPGSARRCARPGSRCPRTTVVARSAGNLWAIAQRGLRETKPSRSCNERLVDLVDHAVDVVAERGALAPRWRDNAPASRSADRHSFVSGLTGRPKSAEGGDRAHLRRRPSGALISPQA